MASISRRGDFWRARIRTKGQVLTKTLDTESEAIAWAYAEEARIVAGESVVQIRKMPTDITVHALFDRYAKEISPTKRGARWEIIRLQKLAPAFPGRVADVDGGKMAEWRDARLREVSASSVHRELNLISAVFTRAIKEWRLPISVNPCRTIVWPRMPNARKRRVSDAERDAIIAELGWDGITEPKDTRQLVAWVFCICLETMMRQGEALALTWEHVHLDRRFCHLPKTKNGHSRNVPMSTKAVALFRLLTPYEGSTRVCDVNAGTLGLYFRKACASAGIQDLHFHDARREALTNASKKLTNVAELARASGHRGLKSLMVYFEPDVEDLARKLE